MLGRTRIVLAVVGLAFVVLGTVTVAQQGPWSRLGEAYRPLVGDSEVVARVEGQPVTRAELRIGVAILELNNNVGPHKTAANQQAALKQIIEVRALAAEAVRRGYSPSEAELSQYIEQVRQGFTAGATAGGQLNEFLSGTGQTQDAFFSSAFARTHYAEAAAVGRLRASVVGGEASPDAANSAWNAFAAAITRQAKVEITDPTLR